MSYYHIIIQQERRTQPERMAQSILDQLHTHSPNHPVRWVKVMVPNPAEKPADWDEEEEGIWPLEIDQGHFEKDVSDPQFVMVAEWDGKSPYVICHKGDYSARTMGYAGWPDMTKEQFDAIPADLPL